MSVDKMIAHARELEEQYRMRAYDSTLKMLDALAKKLLPDGYEVVHAVGWGATVVDAPAGVSRKDWDAETWPEGVREFVKLLDDIAERQGAGNEHFTSAGLLPDDDAPAPTT